MTDVNNEATKKDPKWHTIKITEKVVENAVTNDDEYKKLKQEYLHYKKQVGLLQVAKDSFQHRKDMLVSIGANYRAEGNADPVILRERAKLAYESAVQKTQEERQRTQTETIKQRPNPSAVRRNPPKRVGKKSAA